MDNRIVEMVKAEMHDLGTDGEIQIIKTKLRGIYRVDCNGEFFGMFNTAKGGFEA